MTHGCESAVRYGFGSGLHGGTYEGAFVGRVGCSGDDDGLFLRAHVVGLLPLKLEAVRLSARCWWARLDRKWQSSLAVENRAELSWQVMCLKKPDPVVDVP